MLEACPRLGKGFARVGRARDGTTDDNVCCTTLSRNRRSGNTHLVVAGGAAKLDARRHDEHAVWKAFGEACSVLCGRDHTVASGRHCEPRKKVNLPLDY